MLLISSGSYAIRMKFNSNVRLLMEAAKGNELYYRLDLENRGVRKGGTRGAPAPLRYCGFDFFPIKKLLNFSAVINVQAILGRTH